MIDAQNYHMAEKLKNGSAVIFKAVHSDDKRRFAEAFKNLESESVYTRFFRYRSEFTDEALQTATEVDFENTVALVVAIQAVKGDNQ